MKERPIPFTGPMVKAILDGRKTQTRRVVKLPRWSTGDWGDFEMLDGEPLIVCADTGCLAEIPCPYGQPGDVLWVRESLYVDLLPWANGGSIAVRPEDLDDRDIYYRADGECCDQIPECCCGEVGRTRWRPARFMPRWAARLFLRVEAVRVERLQEISDPDVRVEGITRCQATAAGHWRTAFRHLWDDINAKRGHLWESNPWVWVVTFERIEAP